MFNVPLSREHISQSITPLIHCSVNYNQSDAGPLSQSFFQMIFDAINVLVSARSATSTTAIAVC